MAISYPLYLKAVLCKIFKAVNISWCRLYIRSTCTLNVSVQKLWKQSFFIRIEGFAWHPFLIIVFKVSINSNILLSLIVGFISNFNHLINVSFICLSTTCSHKSPKNSFKNLLKIPLCLTNQCCKLNVFKFEYKKMKG